MVAGEVGHVVAAVAQVAVGSDLGEPEARTTSTAPGPLAAGPGPSPPGEGVDLVRVEPGGAAVVARRGAAEQAPADVGVDGRRPLHAEAGGDLVGVRSLTVINIDHNQD